MGTAGGKWLDEEEKFPSRAKISEFYLSHVFGWEISVRARLLLIARWGEENEQKMTKGAIISPLAKAAVTLTRRNNGGKITDGSSYSRTFTPGSRSGGECAPQHFEEKRN